MNAKTIVEHLSKTLNYNVPADYYDKIKDWQGWWKGFHKPFHEFEERNGSQVIKRKLFTLKMAKKVCEDWAAILLNEKTQIVVGHTESGLFLQGKDGTGGVLGANDFWAQGNALVEKAFYSGTGAFVVKLDGMVVNDDAVVPSANTKIRIEYLSAQHIIPLTVRGGKIIDAAFVSEVMEQGKPYTYLETHILRSDGYTITNYYFESQNEQLKPAPLPAGIAPTVRTGNTIPLFAIVTPNIVNTFEHSNGLGMSIFAHAIDNLMGVDLAFNNLCRDFKLGGKKVFYNASLIQRDGKGREIAPDDVMQQLFVQMGEGELDDQKKLVQEFNPSLRVTDNKDGIQAQLDYLSFKVGLGTKHYQFNGGQIVTATQYMGDKQELIQNAAKHYIVVEQALKQLVKAVLWAGKEILGQPVNPDADITINFEDSYIIDTQTQKLQMLQEIRDGVRQRWEYRVAFMGEDEAKAKQMVGAELTDDELMGFGGGK